jgi:diguanylate cyclase (GGDEF)-like protein/PAS domain S-box-containing protein
VSTIRSIDDLSLHWAILEAIHDGVYMVDRERRILYWNRAAEQITGYPRQEVISRRCMDNILVHCDWKGTNLCQSSCPLLGCMEDGRPREMEVLLRHKEGHRVLVRNRAAPIRDADGAVAGAVEVFEEVEPGWRFWSKLAALAEHCCLDRLTGVLNHDYTECLLSQPLERFLRFGIPAGALFVDIDQLKDRNRHYGREAGNRLMQLVVRSIASELNPDAWLGRWGSDGFVIILPNSSRTAIQRTRTAVQESVGQSSISWWGDRLGVTVSAGGALAESDDTVESWLARAQEDLQRERGGSPASDDGQ